VIYQERELAEVNDCIHEVDAGEIPARIVLRP
jgi:hypothetical protein